MNIIEHENNQHTKEIDAIDKYLKRILQRFFEIENNNTKEAQEAIIVEAIGRAKRDFIQNTDYIFSLNGKTGKIVLTPSFLKGEPLIDKKTAFNKDFGNIEDTICESSDERLYDEREPLPHVHFCSDIKEIKETIDSLSKLSEIHLHNNQNLLDILTYTGTKSSIDLVYIEGLLESLKWKKQNLSLLLSKLNAMQKEYIKQMEKIPGILEQDIKQSTEKEVAKMSWVKDARLYAYSLTMHLKQQADIINALGPTAQNAAQLDSLFAQCDKLKADGEFLIPDGAFVLNSVQDSTYTSGSYTSPVGHSTVTENISFSTVIPDVSNATIKLFFRYDEGSFVKTIPLPYQTIDENGNMICIQGGWNPNGDVCIEVNYATTSNYYLQEYDGQYFGIDHTAKAIANALAAEPNHCLCHIRKQDTNTFIKSLINPSQSYFIGGQYGGLHGEYEFEDNEEMLWFNWASGEPNIDIGWKIQMNGAGLWSIVEDSNARPSVYELIPCKLSTRYTNPRIYYEIYNK